jgi:hypothetical protein
LADVSNEKVGDFLLLLFYISIDWLVLPVLNLQIQIFRIYKAVVFLSYHRIVVPMALTAYVDAYGGHCHVGGHGSDIQ